MRARYIAMLTLSGALLVGGAVRLSMADDNKPTTKPAETDVKGVRLTKPFSEMKDLTADQDTKLKEIHKRFNDERKKLEEAEMDQEMAVLTDAQKAEVKEIVAKDRAKEHATTKPAEK